MKSLSLSKPHLIIVTGVPGAGKTFFAEQFAKTFNAPMISADHLRNIVCDEQSGGVHNERIVTFRLLFNQLEQLLVTKSTIVIDGGSDTRAERQELTKKARASGYDSLVVWVQTDLPTSKHRTVNSAKRHGGKSQYVNLDQYERALNRFTPPNNIENSVVISGRHTYATQARVILKKLTETRSVAPEIARTLEPPAKRSHHILIR